MPTNDQTELIEKLLLRHETISKYFETEGYGDRWVMVSNDVRDTISGITTQLQKWGLLSDFNDRLVTTRNEAKNSLPNNAIEFFSLAERQTWHIDNALQKVVKSFLNGIQLND